MQCEHLSNHLVTGNDREDALVRPGYQLSVTIFNISTVVYIQSTVKHKIILHGGRSWKQLCSHSGRATRWRWQTKLVSCCSTVWWTCDAHYNMHVFMFLLCASVVHSSYAFDTLWSLVFLFLLFFLISCFGAAIYTNKQVHTHTHPFNGPSVWDYPGQPVPER